MAKTPAPNEAIWHKAGVCPQKVLLEFENSAPARTFVKPRPTPSRRPLCAIGAKIS
jgi:hypothetical protein